MRTPCLVALLASAAALAPDTARGAHLYIAWKSGHEGGCRAEVEDFWACLLGASPLDDWLAAFPNGERLALVDTQVIGGNCGDAPPDWSCVVQAAGWEVQPGDVVEYIHAGGCAGHNDHGVVVTTKSGKKVNIRGAELGDGFVGNCHCQTALGMHEIYEAAGDAQDADCCNGQFGCPAAPPSTGGPGWYDLSGCDGTTHRAQSVSPAGHLFDPAYCMMLSIDSTHLCAKPRATRERGVCSGGDLETCTLSPTVTDCKGLGCVDTPAPHCNTFAADCTATWPTAMCSGALAEVTVTCTNPGMAPWPTGVTLGSDPADRDSLFADASWISPRVVAAAMPDAPAGGQSATFRVPLRAPTVIGAIDYTQRFALVVPDAPSLYETADPKALTMAVRVEPCDMAAAADAAAGTGVDGGCACSAGGRSRAPRARWIAIGLLALFLRRRRR